MVYSVRSDIRIRVRVAEEFLTWIWR